MLWWCVRLLLPRPTVDHRLTPPSRWGCELGEAAQAASLTLLCVLLLLLLLSLLL